MCSPRSSRCYPLGRGTSGDAAALRSHVTGHQSRAGRQPPVRDDQPPLANHRLPGDPHHTGGAPRLEVIGPAALTPALAGPSFEPSPGGLDLARPFRSPPSEAAPTPSSSSDDHREWVVPGIFSADLGLPPRFSRALRPGLPPASDQVPSTTDAQEAGASLASLPASPSVSPVSPFGRRLFHARSSSSVTVRALPPARYRGAQLRGSRSISAVSATGSSRLQIGRAHV